MIPAKAIKKVKNEIHLEIAAGSLIAYGIFPQTSEGIQKAKETAASKDTWLAPSDLPDYYDGIDSDLMTGVENDSIRAIRKQLKQFYNISSAGTEDFEDTTVYKPADKFFDDQIEFVLDRESELEEALQETSDRIMDVVDEFIRQDQERLEEFKRKQQEELEKKLEELNKPERVAEEFTIKIPPAHYIQGTAGRWQPEFESDFDHAVYFAGKSPLPKGVKQKEVLEWLKSLGLTFEQIHDHREKVLEKIRETISLPGVEEEYPYVYIDEVEKDFTLDDEEEYDEEDDYEDEEPEGLDDLLDFIKDEEESEEENVPEGLDDLLDSLTNEEADQELADTVEEAIENAVDNEESVDDLVSDLPESILNDEEFVQILNRKKKEVAVRPSTNVTNRTILNSLKTNFGAIAQTLESINKNLEVQNGLISSQIQSNIIVSELISNQTDVLESKFDALFFILNKQAEQAKQFQEKEETAQREAEIEAQRDAAGVSSFEDLTKKDKRGSRQSKIGLYYKRKLLRKLYRKLPKRVRSARSKARRLQKAPGRIANRAVNRIAQRIPGQASKAVTAMKNIRSAGGAASVTKRLPGLRNILAGMEYADRKAAGQSEVQALAGTGAGLAGAAAGGALGAKAGAAAGAAIGVWFGGIGAAPGAGIGAVLGGVLGLLGGYFGGNAAAGAADVMTGANKVDGNYETGGLTKPGLAMLHGTEAILDVDAINKKKHDDVAGSMLSATSKFMSSLGPIAGSFGTNVKGMISQLSKEYDIPSTVVQVPVGGALPSLERTLKSVKKRKAKTPEEELSQMEDDLLNEQNPRSFAEKLLRMLDPEGRFQQLLDSINTNIINPEDYDGTGITGDLKGNIVNPMEGGVMEDYGPAKFGAPRDGGRRKHLGRDLIGPPGMKVVSALPGKVTSIIDIGKLPSGGWSKGIYVKHDNGMETRYLHVHPSVKVGDAVKAGQKIATVTEQDDISSVPHLHFEVIVNGKHVDPEPLVKGSLKLKDISAGKVPGLSIENYSGTEAPPPGKDNGMTPTKPGSETKAPGTTSNNVSEIFKLSKTNSTSSNTGLTDSTGSTTMNGLGSSPSALTLNKPSENIFVSSSGLTTGLTTPTAPAASKPQSSSSSISPPASKPKFESLQGEDQSQDTKYLIVNQQSKPQIGGQGSQSAVKFVPMGDGRWKSSSEMTTQMRNLYMQRLAQ